jgi:hypothetical protein
MEGEVTKQSIRRGGYAEGKLTDTNYQLRTNYNRGLLSALFATPSSRIQYSRPADTSSVSPALKVDLRTVCENAQLVPRLSIKWMSWAFTCKWSRPHV